MSIHLMNQAWRTTLGTGAKFVLVAVCDTANDEGVCWPSVETIRRKCSMGERTVQRHLDDLEQAGILTRSFRKGRSTTYQVHESKFPIESTPAKPAPPQERHPRQDGTPAKSAPTPAKRDTAPPPNSTETPAKLAPRTTNNLKENHQGAGRTPEPASVDNSGPKAAAHGARLPADWVLTKKLALWALQEQPTWTEEHVRKVAAAFRDHWIAQPGIKGRRTDWEATWRNWVRKEPALKGGAGTLQAGGDVRWFETPQGVDAQAKLHGMRERKPDEDWRSYRVLVVRAANDRKAAEFVLADAQRFNSVDLYKFARETFGDALMPVDDFAS